MAGGPTEFKDFDKAAIECNASIDNLIHMAGPSLQQKIESRLGAVYKLHSKQKSKKEKALIPKKISKKAAAQFKKDNKVFNKAIKDYQTKCKKVEKMMKAGLIVGDK